MTETELTVAKPDVNELERRAARIDPTQLERLGLDAGDVVEVEGADRTAATARRGDPVTQRSTTVQIDGVVRQNAGVSISEPVTIRRTEPSAAERLVLAPAGEDAEEVGGHTAGMVKRQLLGDPLVAGDLVPLSSGLQGSFAGAESESLVLAAVETAPPGVVVVTEDTEVELREEPEADHRTELVTYEDVGGLEREVQRVREMVELPMTHPELFRELGISPPKGILLQGPPGTGKTLLARAVAHETNAEFFFISGPEIISKYYGESEQQLRDTFDEASSAAPAIVFVDELDSIAPKRETVSGDVERRIVAQLLTLLDGLEDRGEVTVVATTNRIDSVDPALRRPGRFDREIEIGVPDEAGRLEILRIHTRGMPLADDVDLSALAADTHGYVGADLESLTKEAAMKTLRRTLPAADPSDVELEPGTLEELTVESRDLRAAFVETDPSALREILVEVPEVSWNDVGGLATTKRDLKESVEWPLTIPHHFDRMGMEPPSGVLLYGPPGTGKTLLAKAVATETDANFINVQGPELLSKWVGESEQAVRETFRKAREVAPCVVAFDEIDSIAADRAQVQSTGSDALERVVNQLLSELDGLRAREEVVVVGITNRPDRLDPALVRPGRFDRLVPVGEPDRAGREEILRIHTRDTPLADDVDLAALAGRTDGYVGSDLENIAREAIVRALREDVETEAVRMAHFEDALEDTRPTVTTELRDYFDRVEREFMDEDPESGRRTFR